MRPYISTFNASQVFRRVYRGIVTGIIVAACCLISGKVAHAERLRWVPPRESGEVESTRSGGRRGEETASCILGDDDADLTLLVPDENTVPITVSAQPTFVWYTTQVAAKMQFLLMNASQTDLIYSKTVQTDRSGLFYITLPQEITLDVGTQYRWLVFSDCVDELQSEILVRSFIERREEEQLEQSLEMRSPLAQALAYAEQGFWYDALEQVLLAYDQAPSDQTVSDAFMALLSQGLEPATILQKLRQDIQQENAKPVWLGDEER